MITSAAKRLLATFAGRFSGRTRFANLDESSALRADLAELQAKLRESNGYVEALTGKLVRANARAARATESSERARKVLDEDHKILDWALTTLSVTELARLCSREPLADSVMLVGEGAYAELTAEVLRALKRDVRHVASTDANVPGSDIVLIAPVFAVETYEILARLRAGSRGRVYSLFELFRAACLFKAVEGVLGYHVQPNEKLLGWMTGDIILPPLARLNERFPLAGKRVCEFGPLDGAMTGNLVGLGAGSVTCFEVRLVNVVKTLAARHWLAWNNVQVVTADMHAVDAHTYGRFDLAVAHGVYYHSLAPFRFLENLTTLADVIYLGGFCANPDRLRAPLRELQHEGHVYRAQPYNDKLESDGAGVHPMGYYFMPDDLIAFFERKGLKVEVIDREESAPNKAGGTYLRLLARRV